MQGDTPAACDLNLVNTLKSYYDHISHGRQHPLFSVKNMKALSFQVPPTPLRSSETLDVYVFEQQLQLRLSVKGNTFNLTTANFVKDTCLNCYSGTFYKLRVIMLMPGALENRGISYEDQS